MASHVVFWETNTRVNYWICTTRASLTTTQSPYMVTILFWNVIFKIVACNCQIHNLKCSAPHRLACCYYTYNLKTVTPSIGTQIKWCSNRSTRMPMVCLNTSNNELFTSENVKVQNIIKKKPFLTLPCGPSFSNPVCAALPPTSA